jgi:hypothetical protein
MPFTSNVWFMASLPGRGFKMQDSLNLAMMGESRPAPESLSRPRLIQVNP